MAGSPLLFDFDFTSLIISAKTSGTYSAENDLYSDWKELVQANFGGNAAGAPPAFSESIGGNPVGGGKQVAPYFFLRNDLGWRLRPPEEDGETTIEGNLFATDINKNIVTPTLGGFTQVLRLLISPDALTVTTGVSGLTTAESEALLFIQKLLRNKLITNPVGSGVTTLGSPEVSVPEGTVTLFDDDGTTVLLQADLFEDVAGSVRYRGKGADRRERMT